MQSAKLHHQSISTQAVHRWGLEENMKATVSLVLSIGAIAAAAAILFNFAGNHYPLQPLKYIFVSFFLLISIAAIFIFPKWMPHSQDASGFLFMLLFGSVISLAVFIVFLVASVDGGLLPLSAGAAFILPYAVWQCWIYYVAINPPKLHKPWHIPADMQPETKMSLLLNSLLFGVKIKLKETDTEPILFKLTLTGRLGVGKMFCRFLHDRKGAVETTDAKGNPYGWFFYVKKWHGLKALNPDEALMKNGVMENDVIIIERAIRMTN